MHKNEFTSFDVAAVVRELKTSILDSRVSNVYQLDLQTFLVKLHKANCPPLTLVLEAGRRLHLTSYIVQKPSVPPAFCMALRKHLRNEWLTDIAQYEFERVISFTFKSNEGTLQLIVELFGEGNLILMNETGTILQALSYRRMRDRNILRGEKFVFPPPAGRNPSKVSKEDLREGLRSFGNVEVVRALARYLSIGGVYAEESTRRADVDKARLCDTLNDSEIDSILDSVHHLILQVSSGKLEPAIALNQNGQYVDVVPMRLQRCEGAGFRLQTYNSFDEALDDFYVKTGAIDKTKAEDRTRSLEPEAERLKRIIEDQEKKVVDATDRADRDRKIGDLMYAHASELQALLEKFANDKQNGKQLSETVKEILAEKNRGLTPSVFFEGFDARNAMVSVSINGFAFVLDLRRSLFENAANYYERSKRAKQKLVGAKAALENSLKKLREIEVEIKEAEMSQQTVEVQALSETARHKVRDKEWFEKFRWFISSEGFLVVAGKDAVSNEILIKKRTDRDDIVFHADIAGAPFTVIKTGGKKPSEQSLREAAEFAASFSRAWRERFSSVDVYWVRPEQLSKAGPSGESVARGAFVVRGERNWFRGTTLQQAIGLRLNEGKKAEFVCGPVDAVRSKTKTFVIVVPGDLAGQNLFRRISGILGANAPRELREKILQTSAEEIRDYVPYGRGAMQQH